MAQWDGGVRVRYLALLLPTRGAGVGGGPARLHLTPAVCADTVVGPGRLPTPAAAALSGGEVSRRSRAGPPSLLRLQKFQLKELHLRPETKELPGEFFVHKLGTYLPTDLDMDQSQIVKEKKKMKKMKLLNFKHLTTLQKKLFTY